MPTEFTATTANAVSANELVDVLPGDTLAKSPAATGRPFGLAKADAMGSASCAIWLNGPRTGWLSAGQSVAVGDRLVADPADPGAMKKAPANHTGWIAGTAREATTATGARAALSVNLAPRRV